jgi:hypothetical protein
VRDIKPLNIVGSSRFARFPKISSESTYNMMMSDGALIPYPGYSKIHDIKPGGASGRGIYKSQKYNHLIVVIDDQVFSESTGFAVSFVGSLETFAGSLFITENNANQIFISDGSSKIYIFNYALSTFTKHDVGFKCGSISFIDGYIVAASLDTNEWRLSALNSGASFPFDAQHVGSLQTKPDVVVACATLQRQLFIFGETVAEVWLDLPSSQTLFPFQRQNSIAIDYGCVSPDTVASGFGRLVWLGSNEYSSPSLIVTTGGAAQKLSTDGIEFELGQLKYPENSFGFIFEELGHVIYQIAFPRDNVSYAYDFNEDCFLNVTNHKFGAHIARKLGTFDNKHLFITDKDGGLYEMGGQLYTYKETTTADDKGYTIPRYRTTSSFRMAGSKRFVIDAVSLTTQQGYSNEHLQIGMSMSKDGNVTFGNKLQRVLKPMGDRQNKLIYRKLGSANDVSFQFEFWGKDAFVVTDAQIEVYQ